MSNDYFKFSVLEDLRGFFGSVNSVLSSTRRPKENVLMHLLYSNCVPKLTFGSEIKKFNASQMNQFNVALNTAIRRIFGFCLWQSIRQIREIYNFASIESLFEKAKKRFHNGMIAHDNEILKFLAALHREEEAQERDRTP